MRQMPLPLAAGASPSRIVVGAANAAVVDAFAHAADWPFRTAVLTGPPRSGKSLLAQWFAASGQGNTVDNAEAMDETALFHRWNRAQESGTPLLIVANTTDAGWPDSGWNVALPDLASRLGDDGRSHRHPRRVARLHSWAGCGIIPCPTDGA